MSTLTHGELFAGYGGLGLAVEEVFGAQLAWYAEYDPAASKIMAHHWPDLTNHGVVPQQAAAALRHMLATTPAAPHQGGFFVPKEDAND